MAFVDVKSHALLCALPLPCLQGSRQEGRGEGERVGSLWFPQASWEKRQEPAEQRAGRGKAGGRGAPSGQEMPWVICDTPLNGPA